MNTIKKLLVLSLFVTYLSASSLQSNIKNFVGAHKYNVNKYLILNIFKDKKSFYKHGRLNYVKIFDTLKNNGLFNVNYKSVKDVNIAIYSNAKTVKTIKSIKDVLLNLGYSYYFTKNIKKEENKLSWEIYFKSESLLDPLAFIKELNKLNIRVNNVKRVTSTKWEYKIDVNYANISNSIKIEKDEIKKLRKPHRDYVLEVNRANTLYVTSHRLNQWYPSIAFYDKGFNLIKLDEKSSIKKKIVMNIPHGTKFISISDTYNLINIKRGITVTVK
jgi:hypothetical protein